MTAASLDPTPATTDRGSALRLDLLVTDGVSFLTAAGDIDLATASRLRRAGEHALSPFTSTLRIDLRDVAFIDSTGIGALVAIYNKADADRQTVILHNLQPQVRRVLQLTGMDIAFEIA
jgi:anti-anti-sigma factor